MGQISILVDATIVVAAPAKFHPPPSVPVPHVWTRQSGQRGRPACMKAGAKLRVRALIPPVQPLSAPQFKNAIVDNPWERA